jgi:hypothetical protein
VNPLVGTVKLAVVVGTTEKINGEFLEIIPEFCSKLWAVVSLDDEWPLVLQCI